jgi:starch synthase
LPGGKVGGVGDVIAALPPALTRLGWSTDVLMPGYGTLSELPASRRLTSMPVDFGGTTLEVETFEIPATQDTPRTILFEHPRFSPDGRGRVYCDDGPGRPFATDANKFALFSAACAAYVSGLDRPPDVVHLHDWHAAFYCLLRDYEPRFSALQDIRTVLTIHNLAMQGIRPLDGDASSLASWFPNLAYDYASVVDPRYADCINPMGTAIRLADRVNTVSPTYATEILRPNDEAHGFHGGEGLESLLRDVWSGGRLFGILNGSEYPKQDRRKPGWRRLLDTIGAELAVWQRKDPGRSALLEVAASRLNQLPSRRPRHLLTSIGRLTPQKAALFLERVADGYTALDVILEDLGKTGVFIMLGSGDADLEQAFIAASERHGNFLFLPGYSETFSDLLYKAGDLFLMPSSFEPCGISQMLAMRAGQPCVVHAVGGLKDTIRDNVNGFAFEGDTPQKQAHMFREAVRHALDIRQTNESRWLKIREAARAARFTWDAAAMQYIGELYE